MSIVVKGLADWKICKIFENLGLFFIYEQEGIHSFLLELEDSMIFNDVYKVKFNSDDLEAWGLERAVAEEVSNTDLEGHISIGQIIICVLLKQNHCREPWMATSDGWPAQMNTDVIHTLSHEELYCQQNPQPLPAGIGTKKIPITFVDEMDPHQFLPTVSEDRFLVFHATSWESSLSISSCINVIRSLMKRVRRLDFGYGFYCCKDYDFAQMWAGFPNNVRINGQPCIMIFSLPKSYASESNLLRLEGEHWVDFVSACRQAELHPGCSADAVEGPI